MTALDELINDILCHVNEDGLKLSKTELHDLMCRLMKINLDVKDTIGDLRTDVKLLQIDISRLRNTIGKPLISLIENFGPVVEYQRAEGE